MNTQVVNLSALSPIQLQKVYVKFTKELYILSKLQHPRIIAVYGCATTVEELTLVMEVSTIYTVITMHDDNNHDTMMHAAVIDTLS
jgi:Protein tyrosine and serine/threonine kinase